MPEDDIGKLAKKHGVVPIVPGVKVLGVKTIEAAAREAALSGFRRAVNNDKRTKQRHTRNLNNDVHYKKLHDQLYATLFVTFVDPDKACKALIASARKIGIPKTIDKLTFTPEFLGRRLIVGNKRATLMSPRDITKHLEMIMKHLSENDRAKFKL